MALVAGSPCYPAWRALAGRWRDYTATWRALALPFALPVLAASAPSGALAYGADVQPVSIPAVQAQCGGGPLRLGGGAGVVFAVSVSGPGAVNCGGSAGCALSVAPAADGCITVSALAGYVTLLLLSEASGGALRPSVAPPARLSRGRLTWRA